MTALHPPSHPSPRLAAALLLAAAAFAPHAAAAQTIEIGVRGGAARSTMHTRHAPPPGDRGDMLYVSSSGAHASRNGLAGGVFARLPVAGAFSFQPELLVVQKGFEVTTPTLHPTYLEMPLLLRVDVAHDAEGGGALRPFLLAGVAPAYELRCRLADEPGEDCDAPAAPGFSSATRAWDVGIAVGGGLAVRAGTGSAVLDLRLTNGLRDVEARPRDGHHTRNRSVALSLGYAVPLRR